MAAQTLPLRRWNVGARRIAKKNRTTVHAVLNSDDDRGFVNIIGADDEGRKLGVDTTYSLLLDDDEAREFARASNARFVELDQTCNIPPVAVKPAGDIASSMQIPEASTLAWMGADNLPEWSGSEVLVGVIDGGTTLPVRNAIGCTLFAKKNFTSEALDADGITNTHGCMVTPFAVRRGSKLVEAVTCRRDGVSLHSATAAAIRWMVDLGVPVINYSSAGDSPSSTLLDAIRYVGSKGKVFIASAGNNGLNTLYYPARYCMDYQYVAASIAFNQTTGLRASWSNYADPIRAGVAPGDDVLTLNRLGEPIRVDGTSFSAPNMTGLMVQALTGARFTPLQVLGAFVATARNTAEPREEEGGGAWNLRATMTKLTEQPVVKPWWERW